MIEFRLLGPLEASEDGRRLELPAGKPRALLARLLLDAGRVVAADALVDGLWERPPPSAPKVLQVYVSQLRKAIGAERIETRAPGYRLRVAAEEHDVGRFEGLVSAARAAAEPGRTAELLREALGLWRGPALGEFRHEPFAATAARRLAELRLDALERRVDADLELGGHEGLVPELEALVEQEPLREELRRQLMLALYRSGRQAEALALYREGRRLLVEGLGIEPAPRLQELERAILRHEPALDRAAPVRAPRRGCVVCADARLRELVAPLCRDGRELLLVEIASGREELTERAALLEQLRAELGANARLAAFTSDTPGEDLARLADEQGAELLVVADAPGRLRELASCDLAVAPRPDLPFRADAPVLVPFGGGQDEWAALELAAWLARAHELPLRLLGVEATDERRDASRMLASASLALQRFADTAAAPVLVAPGADGILAERGSLVVASLPPGPLDATRAELTERATVPILFVHGGLRPGGLAPEHTLTRFSWSLADHASR
jgi:DNA-binding SARP family transcriptional activator